MFRIEKMRFMRRRPRNDATVSDAVEHLDVLVERMVEVWGIQHDAVRRLPDGDAVISGCQMQRAGAVVRHISERIHDLSVPHELRRIQSQ